jgi:hypothetical protein
MNHAMAVGTQHRKVRGNVIVHGNALFERADRPEVMRFNKTLANRTIAFRDIKKFAFPSAGTFNCRTVKDTGARSMRAWGAAIDVNTKFADYWLWGPKGQLPESLAFRHRANLRKAWLHLGWQMGTLRHNALRVPGRNCFDDSSGPRPKLAPPPAGASTMGRTTLSCSPPPTRRSNNFNGPAQLYSHGRKRLYIDTEAKR